MLHQLKCFCTSTIGFPPSWSLIPTSPTSKLLCCTTLQPEHEVPSRLPQIAQGHWNPITSQIPKLVLASPASPLTASCLHQEGAALCFPKVRFCCAVLSEKKPGSLQEIKKKKTERRKKSFVKMVLADPLPFSLCPAVVRCQDKQLLHLGSPKKSQAKPPAPPSSRCCLWGL